MSAPERPPPHPCSRPPADSQPAEAGVTLEIELPRRLRPVLREVGAGRSNRDIARRLHLAEHTVEKYVSQLLRLLRCKSRVELALRFARGDFDAKLGSFPD